MNERGLAAHLLYLSETAYEAGDDRPGVANTRWAQWLVDTCATVAEAIAAIATARVVSVPVRGRDLGVHLALEDASGDSAIVEILDGRVVVRHDPRYRVCTNDPAYDAQLENLSRYAPFGGELGLPGGILATDRFVRANYFLHYLPEPVSVEEAVAGAVLVSRNVWVPPGAPYDDFSVYPTWWGIAADLTNHVFYFQHVTSPNLLWIELDELALAADDPTLKLDPHQAGLAGDARPAFAPTGSQPW